MPSPISKFPRSAYQDELQSEFEDRQVFISLYLKSYKHFVYYSGIRTIYQWNDPDGTFNSEEICVPIPCKQHPEITNIYNRFSPCGPFSSTPAYFYWKGTAICLRCKHCPDDVTIHNHSPGMCEGNCSSWKKPDSAYDLILEKPEFFSTLTDLHHDCYLHIRDTFNTIPMIYLGKINPFKRIINKQERMTVIQYIDSLPDE